MSFRASARFWSACGLAAGLVVFGQAPAPAQQAAPLPAAQTIVARHVQGIGGAAAFKTVKSIRATGTFALPGQGVNGTIEVMSARPSRMRLRIDIAGIGKAESGYDGKVGWEIDPMTGPSLLTGRRLSESADDAWFDSQLYESDHVKELTTVSREMFDRRSAYKVKIVTHAGNEQFEYFDAETGLQIGGEATRAMGVGVAPVTSVLRDYKKFGALMQPTTLVQRTLGFEQVMTLTAIEFNTVPDSAFEPPPAVKALIK
jgi:hypothetical protein